MKQSLASTEPRSLAARWRAIISLLVVLHLLAVTGEPLRMFTQGRQPAAPDAGLIRGGLGPYIEFLYLHHGYFFFAPNPGPSHLMDIRLVDDDGSQRHLRLPNHRLQWPRLLYHRHFMLSEFLFQLYTPPVTTDSNANPRVLEDWRHDRELFETVRGSMEKHLAHRYGASRAEIQLMEHRLPSAIEVFDDKVRLDDEKLYVPLPDIALEAGQPGPGTSALGPSSAMPVGGTTNFGNSVMPPLRATPVMPRQTSEEVRP